MKTFARPLLAVALALAAVAAQAHKPSDAYLNLQVDGTRVEARLDVALRDLDRDLVLDADGDGQLSWREVRTRWDDIGRLAWDGLQLQAVPGQPPDVVPARAHFAPAELAVAVGIEHEVAVEVAQGNVQACLDPRAIDLEVEVGVARLVRLRGHRGERQRHREQRSCKGLHGRAAVSARAMRTSA